MIAGLKRELLITSGPEAFDLSGQRGFARRRTELLTQHSLSRCRLFELALVFFVRLVLIYLTVVLPPKRRWMRKFTVQSCVHARATMTKAASCAAVSSHYVFAVCSLRTTVADARSVVPLRSSATNLLLLVVQETTRRRALLSHLDWLHNICPPSFTIVSLPRAHEEVSSSYAASAPSSYNLCRRR